jgi:ABC-type branched-subunit amino acid transport system permease subunit
LEHGKHWQLFMGAFIVLATLLLPNGVIGIFRRSASEDAHG